MNRQFEIKIIILIVGKKIEEIYFDYNEIKKSNLIMAVDEKNVLFYQINKENTTSKKFLEFI